MNAIVERALAAKTMADVESLERMLDASGAKRSRYLGDREANYSPLSGSADPRMLIFERVTNAFDGLIELKVERDRPDLGALTTPRAAAQILYGVPKDEMDPKSGRERDLARLIKIEMLDSDDSRRRPTIAVRDYGIGVGNRESPYTILSLEESNKLKKPYTHGVFGKGGSLACMFSDATIYVLRKDPTILRPGELDLVTVAVIRLVDLPDYGLPFFRYLVTESLDDPRGLPWSCPANDAEFLPGAYVAHINYRAEKMGQQNWYQEESVYALAETLLFRPTLPYTMREGRTGAAKRRPDGREGAVLAGLGARLARTEVPDEVSFEGGASRVPAISHRSKPALVRVPGVGTAMLQWHLFADHDKRRSYAAKGHVVIFLHDGQVHHTWDQQRFVSLVGSRRRVAERLFVEVDTDEVPRKLCRQIFTSFRNELRKIPEAQALEATIAEWLERDLDLRDIEDRLTKEALEKSSEQMSKTFLDRLNRAIALKLPSMGPGPAGPGTGPSPRPPKPLPVLYPEPTAFSAPECITIVAGARRIFYGSLNAIDGFVPDRGKIELENMPKEAELDLSIGDLRRGRVQLRIDVGASGALGTHHVALVVTWLRASGGIGRIEWPLRVDVLAEAADVGTRPETEDEGVNDNGRSRSHVALVWSKAADQKDTGWTQETAGDLQKVSGKVLATRYPNEYSELASVEADVPTIFLNEEYPGWAQYLRSVSRSSDAALRARRERYAIAVGVAIAQLWTRESEISKRQVEWAANQNGGDEPPKPMEEAQMRRAVSEMARGVVALLPDFDRLSAEVRERVPVHA